MNAVGVKSHKVEEEGRRKVGRRDIWVWFAFSVTGMKMWRCLPTESHGVLSFYRPAIGCQCLSCVLVTLNYFLFHAVGEEERLDFIVCCLLCWMQLNTLWVFSKPVESLV